MGKSMLVEAEVWTVARTDRGHAVLVRPIGADVAVPIFIGQLEAQAILIGLGNVPMARPLTHDLILSILKKFEIVLERIEITNLSEDTFFAQLVVRQENNVYIIDSRPSDSIALAVRHHCPIYIAEVVVEEAGIPVSSITEDNEEPGKAAIENEKKRLLEELDKQIMEENYEEAARLRDILKEFEDEKK